MGRTTYVDSTGAARPVPLMIGARLRTAPAWAWKHRWYLTAAGVIIILVCW